MSRKPTTSHLRTIRTSHWRAAARALFAAGLVYAGWGMAEDPGTPEVSAAYWDWVGGAIILVASVLFVAWLPAVFVPHRLIIEDEGFIIRTFWRGDRFYRWKDIAHIWNTSFIWKRSYVRWSNKVEGQIPRRPTYSKDGIVPSGKMWTMPNDEIVKAMDLAKGRYERRRNKGP